MGECSFSECGVSDWVKEECKRMGITQLTPVQRNCIPAALMGQDVIACARTGTGKTLAFAIPIVEQLSKDPYGIFALVITPTRELAEQIGEQFSILGKRLGLKSAVIVGGRDMNEQSQKLQSRPHIIIATPGRLADHIRSHPEIADYFVGLKVVVLDEADRVLGGQYSIDLKTMYTIIPKKRQTLLFSATITDALNQLHHVAVKKPFFYEDSDKETTVSDLAQSYVLCPSDVKDAYLVYCVKNFHQKHAKSSILIFCHTCRECQALSDMFSDLGFNVHALHSQMSQNDRSGALTRFRSSQLKIVVCTDVASRGLHIPNVDLVVNHNIPAEAKTYVHRVGRAARAGNKGAAVSFVTQYDISLLKNIEKHIGVKIEALKINDSKVAKYVTQVLVAKREAEIKLDRNNFGEQREINKRKQMILDGVNAGDVDKVMKDIEDRRKEKNKKRIENVDSTIGKNKNNNATITKAKAIKRKIV